MLGVVSLTINSATDARRFLALETAGQVRRFPGWQEWTTPRFEITSGGPVQVGVDGEALTMDAPVVFEILPAALTVLLPPHAPGGRRRRAGCPRNTPGELWHLALGRSLSGRDGARPAAACRVTPGRCDASGRASTCGGAGRHRPSCA